MKLDPRPHPARVLYRSGDVTQRSAEAWWYDERRGITVVVSVSAMEMVKVRIGRAALAAYLKRTVP